MEKIELENYKLDCFLKDLEEFNISLSKVQLCQFMQYYELLTEWNKVMNLTAITDFDEVCKKHFIDSLSILKAFSSDNNFGNDLDNSSGNSSDNDFCKLCDFLKSLSVIDIGTGAGFPGIPLKIVFPDMRITLLDSLNKRINFLQTVIDELGLKEIEAIHGRAEDFAIKGKLREKYDLCVSRAVANLSTLSEYCIPYVKIGGKFISYKSEKIAEEIAGADKAIKIMGGKVEKQVKFMLPDSDIYRNLVIISKCKNTPAKYPRKAGLPSKEPIL